MFIFMKKFPLLSYRTALWLSLSFIAALTISCITNGDEIITAAGKGGKINISSSSADGNLSSSAMQNDSLCDGKEYDPKTHFCYLNPCGRPPSCDGQVACPDMCYPRETLAKKCNGKEYDPNREECYNENFVACKGQLTDCGGCIEHTDCDGNPVTYKDGTPIVLCWERVREDCLYSPSSSSGIPLCDGKEYDPKTHFCYLNPCGRPPSCDGQVACPDVCYPRETLLPISGVSSSSSIIDTLPCSEKQYDPKTHFCDARDGKVYKFVEIGAQTWMAENLNYNSQGSVCYNPCTLCTWAYDCDIYEGAYRLYDVESVLPKNCSVTNCIGGDVCPAGWHIPTDEEWTELTNFLGNNATKLKAESWQGTDDYGFAALPGVYSKYDNKLQPMQDTGRWWSSTEPFWECPRNENEKDERGMYPVCSRPAPSTYIRQMSSNSDTVLRDSSNFFKDVNAIRCVKGNEACKKQQIPKCGGCVQETDCQGNPISYDGRPSIICYARPLNCVE